MKSRDQASQSASDNRQFFETAQLWGRDREDMNLIECIEAFPRYASRQAIAKFLTKYELFQKILHVNGSIVECGVLYGAGTLAWAKLSSILEPANHTRKIIGFDTFSGFTAPTEQDKGTFSDLKEGGLKGATLEQVQAAVDVYDLNRPISHIPKVELVAGDLKETACAYVLNNPHLVIALLYLDCDLFAPTSAALQWFVPRMPKGAIIVFDELNTRLFPGETEAVQGEIGIDNLEIRRFTFDPYVSYAVL